LRSGIGRCGAGAAGFADGMDRCGVAAGLLGASVWAGVDA